MELSFLPKALKAILLPNAPLPLLKLVQASANKNVEHTIPSMEAEDCVKEAQIMDISLKDLQSKLADFARVRDWDQFHSPRNLLLALALHACVFKNLTMDTCTHHYTHFAGFGFSQVGEVGELSEIFQWKGEVERGLPDWNNSEKEHLGEELSDVLLYLVRLADICGVDLAQAAMRKLIKNGVKYPVERCKVTSHRYASAQKRNLVNAE
eukprot:Gb_18295 [translate_table: standard]